MADENKYIKCSACKCKYLNDNETIKKEFGYTRLNVRLKTCVKCRDKHKIYMIEYRKMRQEEIKKHDKLRNERNERNEYLQKKREEFEEKQLNTEVDENHKCCNICYKIQAITEYGEFKLGVIDNELYEIMLPYKACKTCRDEADIDRHRMKPRRHILERILDPSTSDEEDAIWGGVSD